jgi:acetyl-CoA acetyltransferase
VFVGNDERDERRHSYPRSRSRNHTGWRHGSYVSDWIFLIAPSQMGVQILLGSPEQLTDILLHDGLTDATTSETMGEQAERLAAAYNITRPELDEVAFYSQARAAIATEQGFFKKEIVPIEIKGKKGLQIVDKDEGIRPETTLESLAKLKPAFGKMEYSLQATAVRYRMEQQR